MHPMNSADRPGGPCTEKTLSPNELGGQRQIRQTLGDGLGQLLCSATCSQDLGLCGLGDIARP